VGITDSAAKPAVEFRPRDVDLFSQTHNAEVDIGRDNAYLQLGGHIIRNIRCTSVTILSTLSAPV